MPVYARLAVATLLVVAAGCSGDGPARPGVVGGPPEATPSSTSSSPGVAAGESDLPIDEGGPLVALPACQPAPAGIEADVPGLVLPDGSVVTQVQDQGPLVSVQGYVELTPIKVREFYQQVEGLELFEIEDEVYEAEALFAGPKYRSYVKAQAQCREGSRLLVFVGPGDTGQLPQLGGGP